MKLARFFAYPAQRSLSEEQTSKTLIGWFFPKLGSIGFTGGAGGGGESFVSFSVLLT